LPYIYIKDLDAYFLIDTGSSRSLMNPSLAHKFFPNYIQSETFNIQTAHATSYHNEVAFVPYFNIFNTKGNHKFYLFQFSSKYDGLIGIDLLQKLKANINVDLMKLITPNAEIPIICETPDFGYNENKFSSFTITIPQRTQQVVKLPVNMKSGVGILNYTYFGNNTEMPSALVNVENYFAYTTILNNAENPVKITINEPFVIENIDINELNFCEEIDQNLDMEKDNILKENMKNLRLNHCNLEEKKEIRKLCFEFRDIFHSEKIPLTFTSKIKHKINLTDETPVFTKPYRYPEVYRQEVKNQINQMLDQGIIKPSISPWCSPLWIVPKKIDSSGKRKFRIVIDFRKLNSKTIDDRYPIPNITDILDKLGRSLYFSTLDLANGFYQIEMNPEDTPKTAFSTESGHYEFIRMPQGLRNSPRTFERLMDNVLRGLQNEICFVYLDDIVVFSTSLQEHISRLRKIFTRLREANLKIQMDKSEFLRKEVEFLGHIVTADGVKPNPNKISAVQNFPIPKTQKDIKAFLGLIGYYRRFIKNFAKITKPLTVCLKKNAKIKISSEFINSFEHCKNLLINAPILKYPDFTQEFILTTDASNFAIGAVLSQGSVPYDRPVAFASRTLNDTETKYSTIEKELLAIVWACKYFRPYLFGRKFKIYCDHKPLAYLFKMKEPNTKILRWKLKLEEYDYEIIYKKGTHNTNADALSRIPKIDLNALENESTVNNPGEVDADILEFLKNLAENTNLGNPSIPPKDCNPQPTSTLPDNDAMPSTSNVRILSDICIAPPTVEENDSSSNSSNETPHSVSNDDSLNNGIAILDEIINNKPNQIYISHNPHDNLEVTREHFEKHKILHVKLPRSNSKLIIDFLKEYTCDAKSFYLYFYDNLLYDSFNKIYLKYFYSKNYKLIKCTKLVNSIREHDEKLLLIKQQHEGKCNHRGITETVEHLKRNYYWPSMKKDVTNYINECNTCQKTKYCRRPPYVPLVVTESIGKPFELLHADIFRFDNQEFLTIIDAFSKLSQAIPVTGRTAIEVANGFIQYFSYYGIPNRITLDNGTEFKNETVQELLRSHKIDVHITTPLHHESNSPIERVHSTLIEHLRILRERFKSQNTITLMKYAIIAYNSSIHSATKFTPFDLTFGHTNSRDPSDLVSDTFYNDYVSNHRDKIKHLYESVSQKMQTNKEKVIATRNTEGDNFNFKVGQTVFKKNDRRNKKENKFKGPYIILELLEHHKVKVKNKNNDKTETIHMRELKPIVSESPNAGQDA